MNEHTQRLFDYLQGAARELLRGQGGFVPAGAVVGDGGALTAINPHVHGEQPTPEKAVELLEAGLRQSALQGPCHALGYCVDVTVKAPESEEPVSAVLVSMENADGEGYDVFVPYDAADDYELGTPFGNRRPARIYPSADEARRARDGEPPADG